MFDQKRLRLEMLGLWFLLATADITGGMECGIAPLNPHNMMTTPDMKTTTTTTTTSQPTNLPTSSSSKTTPTTTTPMTSTPGPAPTTTTTKTAPPSTIHGILTKTMKTRKPEPKTLPAVTPTLPTLPRESIDINVNMNININININASGAKDFFGAKRSILQDEQPSPSLNETRSLVLGGSDATEGSWPWLVSLKMDGYHTCGGTIISERFILTAAHCFDGAKEPQHWRVTVGEHHMKNLTHENKDKWQEDLLIDLIIPHEKWNIPNQLQNDLALVRLKRPLDFSREGNLDTDHVSMACLPHRDWNVRNRKDCWLAGWGYYKIEPWEGKWIYYPAEILQEVKGYVWTEEGCKNKWKSTFHPGMLCFGHEKDHINVYGSCLGDSGGPVVCRDNHGRYVVSGVVSFGRSDCLLLPNVFTDVARYQDWIYTKMMLNK